MTMISRRNAKKEQVPVDSFPSDEETAVEDAIDDNYVTKVRSSHDTLFPC